MCAGFLIEKLLKQSGMTQVMLAQAMGRPLKTINEIIKGKARISFQTAIGLEQIFDLSAEYWITMDALHWLKEYRS